MREFKDLTGQKFGKLKVIGFAGMDKHHNKSWLCECECGNQKVVRQGSLVNEITSSCGCSKYDAGYRGKNFVTYNGERKTVFAWSKETGLSYAKLLHAYEKGGESAAIELLKTADVKTE